MKGKKTDVSPHPHFEVECGGSRGLLNELASDSAEISKGQRPGLSHAEEQRSEEVDSSRGEGHFHTGKDVGEVPINHTRVPWERAWTRLQRDLAQEVYQRESRGVEGPMPGAVSLSAEWPATSHITGLVTGGSQCVCGGGGVLETHKMHPRGKSHVYICQAS